jgi:hypothetical protein
MQCGRTCLIFSRACFWAGCWVAILGMLATGCASRRDSARQGGFMRVFTPQPPSFLTSRAAVLLTNWPGFSAQVEVQAGGSPGQERNSSGQLFGRGSKLLYAPVSGEGSDTRRQPAGYSFIWDVAENRGYVLSEALQGYAPVSSSLRVTNVDVGTSKTGAQKFAGHPCDSVTATARTADGVAAEFELLRAMDLNGFPVRIQGDGKTSPFTLSFSKVRLEAPPTALFSPPSDFTKYISPETMADELAGRQNNLKRKTNEPTEPMMPDMQPRRY